MDKLRFQSLASGSSGNCYFIGNASYGFLIDAGIGVRTIRKCLRNLGLDFRNKDFRILGFRGLSFRNEDLRIGFSKRGFKDFRSKRISNLKFR